MKSNPSSNKENPMAREPLGRTLAMLPLLVAMTATAADRQDLRTNAHAISTLHKQTDQGGSPNYHAAFGLGQQEGLTAVSATTDANNVTHTRYRQTLRGVPVWGEQIIISREASGAVRGARGGLIEGLSAHQVPARPTVAGAAALSATKNRIAAGMSQNPVFERESAELVIYLHDGTPRLSWAVSFFADVPGGGEPTRPTVLLDATTGEVIFEYEGLTHAEGTGPGGNAKVGGYHYGSSEPAMDVAASGTTYTMNNANLKTVNLNHGTSGSTAYSYQGPENVHKEINGAYSPLNDAHFFGGVVYDMYNAWVGTPPLTFQLTMRVHYGNNYENAFWNGSAMTFGDGASTFYPLVSLDVSAHEVSHGFTEQNSNLVYSGQSGGINEAFSDMSGEAAEFYMRGSNDWLVGADIFKSPSGALRYMYDPTLDGRSIGSANDYVNGMDVHYSSGVFNKAFYLLATTGGWGVQKAFQTFARANQLYWSSGETFRTAAMGVQDAASDLGFSTADVEAAFSAVDVNLGDVCPAEQVAELGNGASSGEFGASAGEWRCFRLSVTAGGTDASFVLAKTAKGRGGDADLYVQHAALPDTVRYDCRSVSSTSSESCAIATPLEGDWYVGVYAYSSYPGVTLTGSFTDPSGSGGGGGDGGGSGSTDADSDGYTSDVDCDDNNPDVHPDHNDTKGRWGRDGVDNDCNGIIDG
jgi:Zn-dependent metalloprotease